MPEKELFILQLKHNGIPERIYRTLGINEKMMFEKKGGKYFLKEEERRKIKVVLTGGVFDILHAGHVFTLYEAKKFGDVLVVVVATDRTVKKFKKRKPVNNQEYRAFMVNALKPVDVAIVGKNRFDDTIKLVRPDVVVFGYDQKEFPVNGAKIIKLKKSLNEKKFKTSKIIREL
ncbi:MAG: adenylyltransferase/cytidyltransferase family protein, partial [Candidatus Anstonellales archaeon]